MRWMNSDGPLTPAMDNVLAERLGAAALYAASAPGGDGIDVGLNLLRGLTEMGFHVLYAGEPNRTRPERDSATRGATTAGPE